MFNSRYACVAHFSNRYLGSPYYSAGRAWTDYAPAYAFGYDTYCELKPQRFDEAEDQLQRLWLSRHGDSRLGWTEARRAVQETWALLESEAPGHVERASIQQRI